jgi:hypothetical protein
MYDLGTTSRDGKYMVGYEFAETAPSGEEEEILSGEDFGCSPCYSIDSDNAVCSLMAFLTLRKGDTDSEYFENYTPRQLAWTEDYACEVIGCEVSGYEEALGNDDSTDALEHRAWQDCEVNE